MNDALPPLPPTPATPLSIVHPDVWQPLPTRGRILFRLSHAVGFGITGTLAGIGLGVLASAFNQPIWAGPVAGIVIGVLFGAWLGGRRHGYYRWKLDDEGFAVKNGTRTETASSTNFWPS